MKYRAVVKISPHDVIDADGDKPAKRVKAYAIGELLESGTDPDVVQALCDRNMVVPVNLPDEPTPTVKPGPPAKSDA
jgi:hypothetical protein